MTIKQTSPLLIVTLMAAAVSMTGCDQRSADTASKKVDQGAQNVGSATGAAVDKAAMVADDAAITAKVKTAILAEPGLKSLQINVDTKEGTVTLSGTVDDADLRERAKQLVTSTSGVKGVIDQLTVKAS